jgi:hypothetical protein
MCGLLDLVDIENGLFLLFTDTYPKEENILAEWSKVAKRERLLPCFY